MYVKKKQRARIAFTIWKRTNLESSRELVSKLTRFHWGIDYIGVYIYMYIRIYIFQNMLNHPWELCVHFTAIKIVILLSNYYLYQFPITRRAGDLEVSTGERRQAHMQGTSFPLSPSVSDWWMMPCQLGETETTYPRTSSLYICKLESVKTRVCTRYGRQEWTWTNCLSSHLPTLPSSPRLVLSTCWGPTKGTAAESNVSPVFPRLDTVSGGPVGCWLLFSPSRSLSDLRFASSFPAV